MFKKLSVILFCFCSISLYAQTYALVIGSNNGNLIGAESDAYAMSQLLRHKNIQNIKTLYGRDATKANIINAFKSIVNHAKPNDWVYLFFSGHGRSPFDPAIANNKELQRRLKGTGALLTADNQMVIVRESLAPLFRTLDQQKVHTIVIFDACFSGMAYKDIFNQNSNAPFYTPTPTRRATYPYNYLIYLSSTTYSDFASESSRDKRGYFSMAITHCLVKNNSRNNISDCLDEIKDKDKKLPQKPIILPKHNFYVFPNYNKDIKIEPTHFPLKEQLLNLAKVSKDFQLYAQNSQGLTSKNYKIGEKFSIYLDSKLSGYFVLFQRGERNSLKLSYPNREKIPKIRANTNKKIISVIAKGTTRENLIGSFLVDKSSALELQELYKETNGTLSKEANIKKAMQIIERGQIVGSKLLWISHKK